MISIRTMTFEDIPAGMYLKNQAGWNQTRDDWRRFLELQPDGCFVGELDGKSVATASICVLDTVGWIGMVIVDEPLRRRGIGTRMIEHCLQYLDGRGVKTARLDATPAGRYIYERLGFTADYKIVRMEGTATPQKVNPAVEPVESVGQDRLKTICLFDQEVRGTNRHRLIESLYAQSPQNMQAVFSNGGVAGYLTHRDGMVATQIGPSVVLSDDVGRDLADAALVQCAGRKVFMDIPLNNAPATRWAQSRGLTVQRPLLRMHRGKPVNDKPTRQWACSGPEKG